jgi:hypothetical protein
MDFGLSYFGGGVRKGPPMGVLSNNATRKTRRMRLA